jgi:hypothetical protein
MRLSAQFAMWAAIVFTLICVGAAYSAFSGMEGLTDPQALADARGFGWFWLFLAAIAAATGAISWWMVKRDDGSDEG